MQYQCLFVMWPCYCCLYRLGKEAKGEFICFSSFFKMNSNWSIQYKDWVVHCTRWMGIPRKISCPEVELSFHLKWTFHVAWIFLDKFTWIIEIFHLSSSYWFTNHKQTVHKMHNLDILYLSVSLQHLLCTAIW